MNVDLLGQVMTPLELARSMVKLRRNAGTVLEPSSGQGVFLDLVPEAIGAEIDPTLVSERHQGRVTLGNFLRLELPQFDTIVGNPPYVRGKDITCELREPSVLPATANLYLRFVERSFELLVPNGELIFVVPTSLFLGSRGGPLRELMLTHGGFTDVLWNVQCEWDNASVETCVFRYQRGAPSDRTNVDGRSMRLTLRDGFVFFTERQPIAHVGDFFRAVVGAAPRASLKSPTGQAFANVRGEERYDVSDPSKWPRWREPITGPKILFDAGPTRKRPRFRVSNAERFTCHALLPKSSDIDLNAWCSFLEGYTQWQELGFLLNGRWDVGPSALEAAPLERLP